MLSIFLFGGLICLIGQAIITIFKHNGVDDELSSTYMIGIMILAAGVSSAFGFYDRLGQIGKCGFSIPITGFANSMISSAMEYKPEGIILGIGANVFKLASSVLAMGVFSAVMMAIIRYLVSFI
ncbi:MAG: SpoVA/SpoVAEb family sporulation membrane protein [Clostridium sp.]|nr:MAG: SpoVA/SpoVAEb family sporulation membrane protein [Clostridium sp.]